MSGVWGKNIKLSIFGESHGNAIGINIDGLPSGIKLDIEHINKELRRRAPGKNKLESQRKEKDSFEILSGYFNDRTTGTPFCAIIRNSDQTSKDYDKLKYAFRPGHADYTGFIKYKGFNDYRGGGHFSGRLTAPLVLAGAIAKQLLSKKNIIIGSHIKAIGNIDDSCFDSVNLDEKTLEALNKEEFPVIDSDKAVFMKELILNARNELDSIGGVIEGAAINLPAGIGSPFFYSVESHLAHMLFSIPAIKGVEFGAGFDIARMKGSEANDEYYMDEQKIKTKTNNNGGVLGGITNGMPLIFRAAIKPTPSIGRVQKTVNIEKLNDEEVEITGRHDPCIVPRAIPVVEAALAIVLLDLLMDDKSL